MYLLHKTGLGSEDLGKMSAQVAWQKICLQELSYWVILDKLHDSLSLSFPICEMGTLAYTKGLGPGQTPGVGGRFVCMCVCALSVGTQNTAWEGAGSGKTGRERGPGLALREGI